MRGLYRKRSRGLTSFCALAAFLCTCGARAIQAPALPVAQPKAASAPTTDATDESEFFERLNRVTFAQQFRDLKVPSSLASALLAANVAGAVQQLDALAQNGNADANIALLRLQHWCAQVVNEKRPGDAVAQVFDRLPSERAARVKGVLNAHDEFVTRAARSCGSADFQYAAIEARLRQAADRADPASAAELAQFVRDPQRRESLLLAAVSKGSAVAAQLLASSRLLAVQRGERTEEVDSIRALLKQAGQKIPKAKLDFANCAAIGCDGHPAEVATAAVFGMDAARDGEPQAYLAMLTFPWANHLTREEFLAWQYFANRLNEAGCNGASYVIWAGRFSQSIQQLENNQPQETLTRGRNLADQYWRDYAERAKAAQACE